MRNVMLLAILSFGISCAQQEPESNLVMQSDFTLPIKDIVGGNISGDIGPVSDIDTPSIRNYFWSDERYTSMEIVGKSDDRVVMMFVSGSEVEDLFVPDTNIRFEADDYTLTDGNLNVLGCVGYEIDVYDLYDEGADSLDLVVAKNLSNTQAVDVTLTANWDISTGGGNVTSRSATAEFTLIR